MSQKLERLKKLLSELFQLDQADLDFGIYRIMNQKRDEVVRFLDKDLLPQVQEAFKQYKSADKAVLQTELDKLVASVQGAGMNPDDSPKVKELRQRIADSVVDVTALENEVFSHLFSFFRRYYSEGDFISLRRYKEGVYAIPYEGEEVKLHWANADQYYIKSSETFRDYTFRIAGGKRVRVHLVAATTEQGNNKPASGKDRRYVLCADQPLKEEDGELFIRFEYRLIESSDKQDDLNRKAIETILRTPGFDRWVNELSRLAPTDKNSDRTVLEKHLSDYTKKNTFDYFVHKDLGGFLCRELDFYIKNEVMHLDDIEHESAPKVEQYLSQILVIRTIGHKVIRFLEQLETFQKRLWLKKKFVVSTDYCVTLDRVPEKLYPEIAANDAQLDEWKRLFAVDAIKAYRTPLPLDFLSSNKTLLINTTHFSRAFRDQVVANFSDCDDSINGHLVHGDNYHALRLMHPRFADQVRCIYIDPPYNTEVSAIPYKNNYKHSSFATLIHDRAALLRPLLSDQGVLFVSIDKHERTVVEFALDSAFGAENKVEELIWIQNTNDGRSPTYSTNHEYVEVYAKHKPTAEANPRTFREPKPGYVEVAELIETLGPTFPSLEVVETALRKLYKDKRKAYQESIETAELLWEEEKTNDPWNGIYQYKFAEYRDVNGRYVEEGQARINNAKLWVYRESDWTIMSSEDKQSDTINDSHHPNYRFYQPTHPRTGKPCSMPSRGWKGTRYVDPKYPKRNSWESLLADHRIAFGPDENKVPQQKRFLHEVETNVAKSVFADYSDGEKETSALFGRPGIFLAPKHTNFVRRFLRQVVYHDSIVLDCFGGSGSTAHAVIRTNREESQELKFILVEVNTYFDTVLVPRVLKGVYSSQWDRGRPVVRDGLSYCIKIIRLESYEDALNNLSLLRTERQASLIDVDAAVREQYMLSYMLDVESRGSQSLLNVEAFRDPDQYKLRVERNGESQLVNVDLVETFNWLLGLTVKHIDVIRGVRVVQGTDPGGNRVLVLWRNIDKMDNDALDKWFEKQAYNTREMEYDLFYVNGDNNLENLRRVDQTWKVRLIEEEFKRLMFDVQDV